MCGLFVDRRSGRAHRLRRRWPTSPAAIPLLLIGLGLVAFFTIAEDVLSREPAELFLRLDGHARAGARTLAGEPGVRKVASMISRGTGEGLALLVAVAVVGLWVSGRRRDAVILVGGTLGAWGLTAALKLFFAVPRPAASGAVHAITRYGFPSGHAVVATVVAGLFAWLMGRGAAATSRFFLGAVAVAVAVLTATARIILDAHWLSDVTGGLAVGAVWVGLVILAASRAPATGVESPPT